MSPGRAREKSWVTELKLWSLSHWLPFLLRKTVVLWGNVQFTGKNNSRNLRAEMGIFVRCPARHLTTLSSFLSVPAVCFEPSPLLSQIPQICSCLILSSEPLPVALGSHTGPSPGLVVFTNFRALSWKPRLLSVIKLFWKKTSVYICHREASIIWWNSTLNSVVNLKTLEKYVTLIEESKHNHIFVIYLWRILSSNILKTLLWFIL